MSEAVTTRQQELAGKYRPYPEYRDSGVVWLGEMPSTWVLAKTARYFKIAMGQTILKEQLEDDGEWPVYSATEGDHYFGRVNNPQVRLGCGDLVIPARGNSIGFVKLVKEQVTTTQTTIYCKHLTQKIYPEYAYYFMVGQKENLFWFTQTAIPQITVEEIGSNPILLPSFEEQRTIAAFLDYETARIDRLIAQQQRLIELLKEKRQAVISHAVTKGLNPDVPMKDSGVEWLGQVPEHWIVCRLKHIKSSQPNAFVDGPFGSNLKSEHFIENGDAYVIESSFATTGSLDTSELKTITNEHFLTIKRSSTNGGDIIIAKIGARFGSTAILPVLDKPAVVSGNSLKLTVNANAVHVEYVNHLLQHLKLEGALDDGVNVTAQPALSLGTLNNLCFVVPPLEEQQTVVAKISAKNNEYKRLIEQAETFVLLLKERRTALISAAVTGKIDLRGWTQPAEEVAA